MFFAFIMTKEAYVFLLSMFSMDFKAFSLFREKKTSLSNTTILHKTLFTNVFCKMVVFVKCNPLALIIFSNKTVLDSCICQIQHSCLKYYHCLVPVSFAVFNIFVQILKVKKIINDILFILGYIQSM